MNKVSHIADADAAEALTGLLNLIEREVERRVRPLEDLLKAGQGQERAAEEYLDVEELSRRIHTEPKTIRDWIHKKKIPFQKLPTGGVRFAWSEIEAWVKGQES
jgi:excisionase family DNA binding protein